LAKAGGLEVDSCARVLKLDGLSVPGLYTGGGTAVGISGKGYKGYSSGNGLLAATVLDKISGESAAKELVKGVSRT
jgi:fumarate reductase flavoprotein subunit